MIDDVSQWNLDDVEDILWSGTEEQIKNLEGLPVSYSYSAKYRAFDVRYKNCVSFAHKVHFVPNCVKVYGAEHTFDPDFQKFLEQRKSRSEQPKEQSEQ